MANKTISFTIPEEVLDNLVAAVCSVYKYQTKVRKQNAETKAMELVDNTETPIAFTRRKLIEEWAFKVMAQAKLDKSKLDTLTAFEQQKTAISGSIETSVE